MTDTRNAQDRDLDDLISRVALQDRQAFDTLYATTASRLFAVAFRIMKNHAEAEEICQDAYVRIWQRAETFRPGQARPLAWMTTITRNLAIDRIRKTTLPTVSVEYAAAVPDKDPTPEGRVAAAEVKHQIDLCLEELDDVHAAAVRSAYLEGFSYKDLAERYGTPLNTMRTWLRRSLIRLRSCLERETE